MWKKLVIPLRIVVHILSRVGVWSVTFQIIILDTMLAFMRVTDRTKPIVPKKIIGPGDSLNWEEDVRDDS